MIRIHTDGNKLELANGKVVLRTRGDGTCSVALRKGRGELSLNAKASCNAHYAVAGKKTVDRFRILPTETRVRNIRTEFGSGRRVVVKSVDKESLKVPVYRTITYELYDAHPSSVVVRSYYYLLDAGPEIGIDKIVDARMLLDSRRAGGESPHAFWSSQTSAETREHFLIEMTPGFHRRNFSGFLESAEGTGHDPTYRGGTSPGYGGGLPVSYLWNKQMGVALGCIEKDYILCSLPVRTRRDGLVEIAFEHEPPAALSIRSPISSPRLMLGAFTGDYFAPYAEYSSFLGEQGLTFPKGVKEAFEPSWCSYGYEADFTMDDVRTILPKLKTMGIKWVVLDDRWFDNDGDWMPRKDHFPGDTLKGFVKELHDEGFKVMLWLIPGVYTGYFDDRQWVKDHPKAFVEMHKHPWVKHSRIAKQHPEWSIVDRNGTIEKAKRGTEYTCGALPEVLDYHREMIRRFFEDYDVDGLKMDAVYAHPPCYNPEHQHKDPMDAADGLKNIMRVVYEEAMRIKPGAVLMICPCGTPATHTIMAYQNQAVTADPSHPWAHRSYHKLMYAMIGDGAAIFADHIEQISARDNFASQIALGSVPGTRFHPDGRDKEREQGYGIYYVVPFDEERVNVYKRWMDIFRKHKIYKGRYVNCYDIQHDVPESHLVVKGDKRYYSFFQDERSKRARALHFAGQVEFRELERGKTYRVHDYVNNVDMGVITGPKARMKVEFDDDLLVVVTPLDGRAKKKPASKARAKGARR